MDLTTRSALLNGYRVKVAGIDPEILTSFSHHVKLANVKRKLLSRAKDWLGDKAIRWGRQGGKATSWGSGRYKSQFQQARGTTPFRDASGAKRSPKQYQKAITKRQAPIAKRYAAAQTAAADRGKGMTLGENLGMKNILGFRRFAPQGAVAGSGSGRFGGVGGAKAHRGRYEGRRSKRPGGTGRNIAGQLLARNEGVRGMKALVGDAAYGVGRGIQGAQALGGTLRSGLKSARRGAGKYHRRLHKDTLLTGAGRPGYNTALRNIGGYGLPTAALGGVGYGGYKMAT
jgi:hypothetical protein